MEYGIGELKNAQRRQFASYPKLSRAPVHLKFEIARQLFADQRIYVWRRARRQLKLIARVGEKEWKHLSVSVVRACFNFYHVPRNVDVLELWTSNLSRRNQSEVLTAHHLVCHRSRQTPNHAWVEEYEPFIERSM